MSNEIKKNDSRSNLDFFVVVRDEADKVLATLEQIPVNKHIDLKNLKTISELENFDNLSTSPQVGNIYIFSEFSKKYIKVDTNNELLGEIKARCQLFRQLCRKVRVKYVRYSYEESSSTNEAKEKKGKISGSYNDIDGHAGGEYKDTSSISNKHNIDYESRNISVGDNYDARNVEDFYKENRLERFEEFVDLYEHWKQMSGSEFAIELAYISKLYSNRSLALDVGTTIMDSFSLNIEYQQQETFETEKSSRRKICVKFFEPEEYKKYGHVETAQNGTGEIPKAKRYIYLWISIAVAAFIAGAILCLCLIKLV